MGLIAETERPRPIRIYHTHSRSRTSLFPPVSHEKRRTHRSSLPLYRIFIITTAVLITYLISQRNFTTPDPIPPLPSSKAPLQNPLPPKLSPDPHSAVLHISHDLIPPKHPDPSFRDPTNISSFSDQTALNYFHLHKTGGVSFKERLFDFFMDESRHNAHGANPVVVDTCYQSGPARPALGIEAKWSCDWGEMANKTEKQRNNIDVVLGHQYWEKGTPFWLPSRDLRYFTVMRHPLHRKISFFYHFFVRNAGRKEDDVTADELIQFVLGKKMPDSPLIRDAGPAYYASRLWSDGITGFSNTNRFIIPDSDTDTMVLNSIQRLRRNFLFIGLQTQENASLCMLKLMVEKFALAQGFDNIRGVDAIAAPRKRMNTGSYALSGRILWARMTEQQRQEYKHVERVDLAIYKESVSMFHEMTKRFGCAHLEDEQDEDDKIAL